MVNVLFMHFAIQPNGSAAGFVTRDPDTGLVNTNLGGIFVEFAGRSAPALTTSFEVVA